MFLTKEMKQEPLIFEVEMVSFEHVGFWPENHLLNPTTELTLVCINSIETLESVIFFPECLFFSLRLLLTHEVHLLHYI